jgi:hypothetical protein
MPVPSTKPLDGLFWYVVDDKDNLAWRPCPKLRGNFYLGWLGQEKTVVGVGLMRMEQGQITHICTHGTPYYWLQPYEVLPYTSETIRAQELQGADTMKLDFSLAGWGFRDQTLAETRQWSDAPIASADLEPLLVQAVAILVRNFRSEGEPSPKPEQSGLLSRTQPAHPTDPIVELLDLLKKELGEPNVVPVLIELVRHDVNVLPGFRHSDFFENLVTNEEWPSSSKVAGLVLSAVYHLAPLLGSRRLNGTLLLNSLRQRHPFDVAWGADPLIKCVSMTGLVRLLLAALLKEQDDQVRGNVLDLLQELGYGSSAGLELEVLKSLAGLQSREDLGAFSQVINSHFAFLKEYMRQSKIFTDLAD